MVDYKRIGAELKAYFADKNIRQEDMALTLGVSQQAVSALLNGKPFGKKNAEKWSSAFGIQFNWLLTGEGEMLKGTRRESQGPPAQNDDFVPLFYKVANAVEKIAESNQELTATNSKLADSNSELVRKLAALMDEVNTLRTKKIAKYPAQEDVAQVASDIGAE